MVRIVKLKVQNVQPQMTQVGQLAHQGQLGLHLKSAASQPRDERTNVQQIEEQQDAVCETQKTELEMLEEQNKLNFKKDRLERYYNERLERQLEGFKNFKKILGKTKVQDGRWVQWKMKDVYNSNANVDGWEQYYNQNHSQEEEGRKQLLREEIKRGNLELEVERKRVLSRKEKQQEELRKQKEIRSYEEKRLNKAGEFVEVVTEEKVVKVDASRNFTVSLKFTSSKTIYFQLPKPKYITVENLKVGDMVEGKFRSRVTGKDKWLPAKVMGEEMSSLYCEKTKAYIEKKEFLLEDLDGWRFRSDQSNIRVSQPQQKQDASIFNYFNVEQKVGSGSSGTVYKVHQISNKQSIQKLHQNKQIVDGVNNISTQNTQVQAIKCQPIKTYSNKLIDEFKCQDLAFKSELNQKFNVIAEVYEHHIVTKKSVSSFSSTGMLGEELGVILMPFHPEGSLQDLILKQEKQWRDDTQSNAKMIHELRCLKILRQLLQSAKVLDELDIVHNDYKPANILVTQPQESQSHDIKIQLQDFGLADSRKSRRRVGRCGTLGYIAPEVSSGGYLNTDFKKNDLYQIGLIFCRLLQIYEIEIDVDCKPADSIHKYWQNLLFSGRQRHPEIGFWNPLTYTLRNRLRCRNVEDRLDVDDQLSLVDKQIQDVSPIQYNSSGV